MIRIFKHHISGSFLLLAAVEWLLITLSLYASFALHFQDGAARNLLTDTLFPKALFFSLAMLLGMASMGMYHRGYRDKIEALLLRTLISFLLGIVLMSLLFYLAPSLVVDRGQLMQATAIAFLGVVGARCLFSRYVDQRILKRRVLVLGAGHKANLLSQLRRGADNRGFEVVGYLAAPGQEECVNPHKILRQEGTLAQLTEELGIEEIVIAVDDRRNSLPVREILECKMNGVQVLDLLSFFERETGRVMTEALNPSWMIFSDGFSVGAMRAGLKRAFDIVISLVMVLITWPVMVLVAGAIFVESGFRGPIFYHQVRIGQGARRFGVLKFRSMRPDAERDGVARWAEKNDSRITRLGAFLRQTRLDELPQLFNVLKGDMSFVGPRPERPEFVVTLDLKIPYYMERHRVKPGITGWAQIRYPYGASERDAEMKLQYDLYYIKNFSIFLDLMILLQTAEVILWGKGAR